MVSRSNHYNARYRFDLSPRQREVLEFIAAGRTNAEIAAMLGITLDGAKWHVREILAKLEVESREEAVAAWRDHNQPAARLWRALSGIALPVAARWIAVSAVAGTAITGGAALYMALQSGGSDLERAQSAAPAADADGTLPSCDGSQIVLGLDVQPWLGRMLITVDITNTGADCTAGALLMRIPNGADSIAVLGGTGVVPRITTMEFYFEALVAAAPLRAGKREQRRFAWTNGCVPRAQSPFVISVTMASAKAATLTTASPPCDRPNDPPTLRRLPLQSAGAIPLE